MIYMRSSIVGIPALDKVASHIPRRAAVGLPQSEGVRLSASLRGNSRDLEDCPFRARPMRLDEDCADHVAGKKAWRRQLGATPHLHIRLSPNRRFSPFETPVRRSDSHEIHLPARAIADAARDL